MRQSPRGGDPPGYRLPGTMANGQWGTSPPALMETTMNTSFARANAARVRPDVHHCDKWLRMAVSFARTLHGGRSTDSHESIERIDRGISSTRPSPAPRGDGHGRSSECVK